MSQPTMFGKYPKQKLDCRTCGACCVSPIDQPSYADVTDRDITRLGHNARLKVIDGALATRWVTPSTGPLANFQVCQCSMLQGSPLSKVSCRIYNHRPEACRDAVKPGDSNCLAARSYLSYEVGGMK